MITLGAHVKDVVTGFEGIAMARTTNLFAAPQVQVQPREVINGAPAAAQWFEEARLVSQAKPIVVGFNV